MRINPILRFLTAIAASIIILGCSAKSSPHRVVLTWEASRTANGIPASSYNVYRSTGSDKQFAKIASGVAYTWYEDTEVKSGQTYLYAVTALDPIGDESKLSAEVEAKIP